MKLRNRAGEAPLRSGNAVVPLSLAALASVAVYFAGGDLSLLDVWRLGSARLAASGPPLSGAPAFGSAADLPAFGEIVLRGGEDATIQIGEYASVAIDSDADGNRHVSTEIDRNRLVITGDGRTAHITVTVPHLRSLHLDGSGHTILSGLRDPIAIEVNGTGDVEAAGTVPSVEATVNGPGRLDLSGLRTERAKIVLNGPGGAPGHAVERWMGVGRDSGRLRYCGDTQGDPTVIWPGMIGKTAVPPAG
jgi:hypothetical protein